MASFLRAAGLADVEVAALATWDVDDLVRRLALALRQQTACPRITHRAIQTIAQASRGAPDPSLFLRDVVIASHAGIPLVQGLLASSQISLDRCTRSRAVQDVGEVAVRLDVGTVDRLVAMPLCAFESAWVSAVFDLTLSPKRWECVLHLLQTVRPDLPRGRLTTRIRGNRVPREQLDVVVALFAGTTGCSPGQWRCVRRVLEILALPSYTAPRLREVCQLAPRMPEQVGTLQPLDHRGLLALLGLDPAGRLPTYLDAAKRQPALDPDGHYSSHLCRVSTATMSLANGALWGFPLDLPVALEQYGVPREDAQRLALLADAIAAARASVVPGRRLQERTRADVGAQVACIARTLYDRQPAVSIGGLLAPPVTLERLTSLAAHVEARHNQRIQEAGRAGEPDAGPRYPVFSLLRGALRAGVFAPSIPPHEVLRPQALRRAMEDLEARDPTRWRARPPERPASDCTGLTQDEVDAMLQAAQGLRARHRVVLLLLYTTGLRAGAIAHMRLENVWDDRHGVVRQTWAILEKFSSHRRIVPCAELREAMHRYVTREHHRSCRYLFGSVLRPQNLPRSLARNLLGVICRRAGLRHVGPHAFRRYIVTLFMRHKNSLDQAAKFLGHSNASITYKHYWRTDTERLAQDIPFFCAADGSGGVGGGPKGGGEDAATTGISTGAALEFEQSRRLELEAEVQALRLQLQRMQQRGGDAAEEEDEEEEEEEKADDGGHVARDTNKVDDGASSSSLWDPLTGM